MYYRAVIIFVRTTQTSNLVNFSFATVKDNADFCVSDTSFMYVTAVLCMVKLYQTRHPDINATAYATFGVLAIAILLGAFQLLKKKTKEARNRFCFSGMVGILEANLYFWIGFTVLHLMTCIYLSVHVYYMGCWKMNRETFRRFGQTFSNDYQSGFCNAFKPFYKGKLLASLCLHHFLVFSSFVLIFWH